MVRIHRFILVFFLLHRVVLRLRRTLRLRRDIVAPSRLRFWDDVCPADHFHLPVHVQTPCEVLALPAECVQVDAIFLRVLVRVVSQSVAHDAERQK